MYVYTPPHIYMYLYIETNDTCAYKILLLGYLLIEIWDHDFGNPDDFIGRLVIPLSSLPLSRVSATPTSYMSTYNAVL